MFRLWLIIGLVSFGCFLHGEENLLKNGSFEDGTESWKINPSWFTKDRESAKFSLDSEHIKGAGQAALKIESNNHKGLIYQTIRLKKNIPEYILSIDARTIDFAKDQKSLKIIIESKDKKGKHLGQCYMGTRWIKDEPEYTNLKKRFKPSAGASWLSILIQVPATTGKAWIDNITLIPAGNDDKTAQTAKEKVKKVSLIKSFRFNAKCNTYVSNDPIKFTATFANLDAKKDSYSLQYQIIDYNNDLLLKKSIPLSKGGMITETLANIKKYGFFVLNYSLLKNNKIIKKGKQSFCILFPRKKNDPFFGLSMFLMRYQNADIAAKMGVGSIGVDLSWARAEKEKGKYNFSSFDKKVNQYLKYGINPTGGIYIARKGKSPMWAEKLHSSGKNDLYNEHFANYIKALSKHFKGKIDEFAYINEIDLSMKHKGVFDWYIGMVKAGTPAFKKGNPEGIIGGVGVSSCDLTVAADFKVARQVWKAAPNAFDGFFMDYYVDPKSFGPGYHPVGPERGSLREGLQKAVRLANKYNKNLIAIEEKGVKIVTALPVDSIYAKQMGEVISRSFIIAKSIPECLHYHYFTLESGEFFKSRKHKFEYGLYKCTYDDNIDTGKVLNPRPAVTTYSTTARMLSFTKSPVKVNLHKKLFIFTFKKDKGSVAALWTISPNPLQINLGSIQKEDVTFIDLMGNEMEFTKVVKLTTAPIFLETKLSQEKLNNILQKATFNLVPVRAEFALSSIQKGYLYITNQLNKKLAIECSTTHGNDSIRFTKDNLKISLKPLETKKIAVNLKQPELKSVNHKYAQFIFSYNGQQVASLKKYIDLTPVYKANTEDKKATFNIQEMGNVYPADAIPAGLWTGNDDLSIKAWLTYDKDNFYFTAEVTDDSHCQKRTGPDIWMNDSFQIGFDIKADALDPTFNNKSGYDSNDIELGIALTPKGPQVFSWQHPTDKYQNQPIPCPLSIKKISANKLLYKLTVPCKLLNISCIEPGQIIGFTFNCLDSEKGETASYWMGPSEGIIQGKDPSKFKKLVFLGSNK